MADFHRWLRRVDRLSDDTKALLFGVVAVVALLLLIVIGWVFDLVLQLLPWIVGMASAAGIGWIAWRVARARSASADEHEVAALHVVLVEQLPTAANLAASNAGIAQSFVSAEPPRSIDQAPQLRAPTADQIAHAGPPADVQPPLLFISYCHHDDAFRQQLLLYLRPLEAQGELRVWHDRRLTPGAEWKPEILHHLRNSDMVAFLITQSWLASTACQIEWREAVARHREGLARLVPIVVDHCQWNRHMEVGDIQMMPTDAKPIVSYGRHSKAWNEVAEKIADVASGLRGKH
ncbi:MAG: toll/interleukin-1 receptor domain-containing protein [Planctomycetota bacterium]